ncbi:MAG: sugar phosphate isomerase/epimerase [Verrucomicrobiales bacterium]|nr:sugar phosphate isomerase/epimerase [Verrucomicrobiales bacterium]
MNRRRFVQTATAALTLGTAATQWTACSSRPRRRNLRLSASSLLFKELTLEQACERISGLGFEAIDIWSGYEGCQHLDDAARRLGGAGLRDLLARSRLKLYAFSTYVGGYEKYAQFLGDAGGGVAVQGSGPACPPNELSSRMAAFLEGLAPLAELAEKNNSWLAIENHTNALLDTTDSLKAFVDLNKYPRVGIALAPYHLQALGASVPEAIRIAGKQLLFFYAWQNGAAMRQLPGIGPADFRPWLDALAAIQYPWYLNLFMHGYVAPDAMSNALARSRNYLIRPA